MLIYHDPVLYDKNNKYIRTFNHIHFDNRLSAMARLLFPVIHNWDVKSQSKRRPSIKSLSTQFGVCTDVIDRAVIELKKYGYLTSTNNREFTVWWTHPYPDKSNIEYVEPDLSE